MSLVIENYDYSHFAYLGVLFPDDVEESVQDLREEDEHVDVRHRVQRAHLQHTSVISPTAHIVSVISHLQHTLYQLSHLQHTKCFQDFFKRFSFIFFISFFFT